MRVVSFEGASGHRFWQLAFRNLGATCSLHGFSRVLLLAHSGRSITDGFKRETGFAQSTVTLERGKSAFVAFTYRDGEGRVALQPRSEVNPRYSMGFAVGFDPAWRPDLRD